MPPLPGMPGSTGSGRDERPRLGVLGTAEQLTLLGQISPQLVDGLDVVALSGPVGTGLVRWLQARTCTVLILVTSVEQLSPALASAADGVITTAEAAMPSSASVDAVLSDTGPQRRVTSVAAARRAFAAGADLVLYDLGAMLADLVDTLPHGRVPTHAALEREPLVLLSGMLGDATLWDPVAGLVADLVAPWPGRIDLDDSVPEMAASVLAEAPPRFALAGHSLGAIVALEIVREAPDRVTRLVLLNASARGPVEAQVEAWSRWRQRTVDGEFDQVVAELAVTTLGQARRSDTALVRANARMARSIGAEGFVRQLSAQATRPDSRDSLGSIRVPVLVMSGELDEVCPPARQHELVDACPAAELVSIPGGGHMLPLDSPDAVAGHLRAWLTRDHVPPARPPAAGSVPTQ